MRRLLLTAALALAATPALAATGVDPGVLNRIADEGFNRGQVMQTVEHLADHIGGRMTNSPAMRKAEDWTAGKFREWGLSDVHKEGFDFGRGWWIEDASVRMIEPRPIMLHSIPIAWTPPTNGTLRAPVIVAPIARESDFAKWRGKLAGKIVLLSAPTPPRDNTTPPFERLTDAETPSSIPIACPSTTPSGRPWA
jgi:carboxypeptidase Q